MLLWVLKLSNFLEKAWAQTGGGPLPTGGGPSPTGGNLGGGQSFPLVNPLACGNEPNAFACIAERIIGAIFTISIPVTSIMVLVGGFQILTAGGDPEKFSRGRRTLIYAAVGFAIILISGSVVSILRSSLNL